MKQVRSSPEFHSPRPLGLSTKIIMCIYPQNLDKSELETITVLFRGVFERHLQGRSAESPQGSATDHFSSTLCVVTLATKTLLVLDILNIQLCFSAPRQRRVRTRTESAYTTSAREYSQRWAPLDRSIAATQLAGVGHGVHRSHDIFHTRVIAKHLH